MSTDPVTTERCSFWRNQTAPRPTIRQVAFDIAFGIALPVICLYFDPIVFQGPFGPPLLGRHALVARAAIGLGLLSLSAWMLLGRSPAFMAGLLAGGALVATALGLVLLPLSLVALVAVIGVLGFSPFLTAFVFWRNAVRAYRRTRQGRVVGGVRIWMAVGLAIACGGPWAVEAYIAYESSRALEMVQSRDPAEGAQGIAVLKRFRVVADYDRLVFAYGAEKDAERRKRLAEVYKELTGTKIEHRLATLRD